MTSENIKDVRLMCELIAKDYERLSKDMRTLSEFLLPLQKEYDKANCNTCKFSRQWYYKNPPCCDCSNHSLYERKTDVENV